MEEIRDENPPSSFCQNDSKVQFLGFRQIKWISSKFAAAFGAEFPPCAAFPLTNKQVHVQKVPLRAISSSLCPALKFILILKRAALLLATSLRLLFLKPHWEFSPHVFPFPVRASRCYSCAVFSFRMCQDLIPPLLFF